MMVCMFSPPIRSVKRLKNVLEYLKGTIDIGIADERSRNERHNILTDSVDVNHAGERHEEYSTAGYVFYMEGGRALSGKADR